MDEPKYITSTFNMSLSTLERIDNILRKLHQFHYLNDLLSKKFLLESLYLELTPFLNDEEDSQAVDFISQIKENGFFVDPNTQNAVTYNIEIVMIMWDFEKWMRRQLHDKGLLMAKSDDPAMALAEW